MKKAFGALLVLALVGCAVTEQGKSSSVEGIAKSGFLTDYSKLKPGGKDQALLVYFNPNVQWSQYNSIKLEPVTVGARSDHQLSPQDELALTSYYYGSLQTALSKNFTLVDHAGPGVMTVRVALTDASSATPVLRTVSVVIPQARLLGMVKNLATGTYAFVGSAQSEGEVLDSVTGEQLAAAVDQRSGGMSVKNAGVWEWGDAQNAMDYWAQRTDQRLDSLHTGKPMVSQQ